MSKNEGLQMAFWEMGILAFDRGMRTFFRVGQPWRPSPASGLKESFLKEEEKKRSARLLRVDHAGEVAAQALYLGQSLFARDPKLRDLLFSMGEDEQDHLFWCAKRLDELHAKTSMLDPFWFFGALAIGSGAAFLGDKASLSFLLETESQVVEHLRAQLDLASSRDGKTREILSGMQADEWAHGERAWSLGGRTPPFWVREAMRLASQVMIQAAARL